MERRMRQIEAGTARLARKIQEYERKSLANVESEIARYAKALVEEGKAPNLAAATVEVLNTHPELETLLARARGDYVPVDVSDEPEALTTLKRIARDIAKREEIDVAEAMVKAAETRPDLYATYREAIRGE